MHVTNFAERHDGRLYFVSIGQKISNGFRFITLILAWKLLIKDTKNLIKPRYLVSEG